MAAPSWSNPNPSGQTAGELGSKFDVQAGSIGTVIAAILKARQDKADRDRQSQQDLIRGIGTLAGGINKDYQGGQMDDAANRAIYQAQNPNDPFTGQQGYDDRVPDYGGTQGYDTQLNAAKLQKIQEALTGGGWENDLKRQMMQSRINASDALASQRYGKGAAASGDDMSDDATRRGQTYDDSTTGPQVYEDPVTHERWRQGSGGHWYPMSGPKAAKESQVKMSAADKDAVASNAPELPGQTVYPDESGPAPAETGIAASREEAKPGQHYRAPDGSIRIRQN